MQTPIITDEKPNPVQQLYPTTIVLDYMDELDLDTLKLLPHWVRSQGWHDSGVNFLNCTRSGEQYEVPEGKILWDYTMAPGMEEIQEAVQKRLNLWVNAVTGQECYEASAYYWHFTFYKEHGYQLPHIHQWEWTAIVGLRNNGTVIIQDPRGIAVGQGNHMVHKEIIVNPGQILIIPGYITHSSVPCYHPDGRDILVINGN